MRAIPFFIVLFILVAGAATALQTLNAPPEVTGTPTERPTVTPRPRPTSPRAAAATATAEAMATAAAEATASAAQAAAAPEPPTATPSPTPPSPTPSGSRGRTPTATPGGQPTLRVGNTGGEGVYLRRTPNMDDRIRPWMDGTPMVVIGPRVAGDGKIWEKVRAPDGVEGYIPTEYLVGGP